MKHLKPSKVVLIGASTGGPGQIDKIITSLCVLQKTSVIIAQHMADGFMESFMNRLKKSNQFKTQMTKNNVFLTVNTVYICEKNIMLVNKQDNLIFQEKEKTINSYNPDINLIFSSFSSLCSEIEILSVILTGIGDDGVKACVGLSSSGARCITETSQSAIIDGMPKRARELVPNIEAYNIDDIVKIISEFCE